MQQSNRLILTADVDFADLALDEFRAQTPGSSVLASLAPGIFLLESDRSFVELAEAWRVSPPIFVRHICPVQAAIDLTGSTDDLTAMGKYIRAECAPLLDPELSFSVQTRLLTKLPYKPFDVNITLSAILKEATGAALDVRSPQQILSVVSGRVTGDGVISGGAVSDDGIDAQAYIGLSLAVHNLSDWAGGMRRFAREKGQVSRSEFKLLEALEVFQIDLPPRGVALDLGASPGGWTRVLRQREQYVTAVDPGDLDPRVASDRGVRHKRLTAEIYLGDEPDDFDIIVNDMRMDARDSARLMVDYAQQLRRHGVALMTLKLPTQRRRDVIDHAFKILRSGYQITGARQLFHNRSEITVCLTRA